jgi:hypothetical protein
MSRTPRSEIMAAVFLCLAAILFGGIWYLYLFVAPLPGKTALESARRTLQYTFSSENELRNAYFWIAALPAACIALAIAYLSNAAKSKRWAIFLFVATLVLAFTTLLLVDPALAVFVALPAIWGFKCVRGA